MARRFESGKEMTLITVEKIGDSEPVPFKKDGKSPLDGIRAFGMGRVTAGGTIGRDLAPHGADLAARRYRH